MSARNVGLTLLVLASCSSPSGELTPCGVAPLLQVAGHGAPANDGTAMVYGTTRLAPLAQTADGGVEAIATERAVHDVYVAGARVTQHDFNFRAWTLMLEAGRLCAFTVPGTHSAILPVRVYLAGPTGVCVYEVPDEERIVVEITGGKCVADAGVETSQDAGN